jgi:hypothetical protein
MSLGRTDPELDQKLRQMLVDACAPISEEARRIELAKRVDILFKIVAPNKEQEVQLALIRNRVLGKTEQA